MHLNAHSEQIDLADAQDVSEVHSATHTGPVWSNQCHSHRTCL